MMLINQIKSKTIKTFLKFASSYISESVFASGQFLFSFFDIGEQTVGVLTERVAYEFFSSVFRILMNDDLTKILISLAE